MKLLKLRPAIIFTAFFSCVLLFASVCVVCASGGSESVDVAMWKDFAWRCFNFSILVGLLYWLLAKKIRDFFSGRRGEIKKALEEAEQAKDEPDRADGKWNVEEAKERQIREAKYIELGHLSHDPVVEPGDVGDQTEFVGCGRIVRKQENR